MIDRRSRRFSLRGISLVEVLISLVLLSIGILGLVKLQVYIEQQSSFATQSVKALKLADEKLDSFRSRGATSGSVAHVAYNDIDSGTETVAPYTMTWTVTDQHIGPPAPGGESDGAKLVALTVKWKDRMEKEHTIQLKTMIGKYSEFD